MLLSQCSVDQRRNRIRLCDYQAADLTYHCKSHVINYSTNNVLLLAV